MIPTHSGSALAHPWPLSLGLGSTALLLWGLAVYVAKRRRQRGVLDPLNLRDDRGVYHALASASGTKAPKFSFEDARRQAHNYGFTSKEEYQEYKCAGAYGPPRDPEAAYAGQFVDWEDWLGVPLSFAEGRAVVRTLGLRARDEYAAFKGGAGPAPPYGGDERRCDVRMRLPARPDLKYRKDWRGWEDWLGLE